VTLYDFYQTLIYSGIFINIGVLFQMSNQLPVFYYHLVLELFRLADQLHHLFVIILLAEHFIPQIM